MPDQASGLGEGLGGPLCLLLSPVSPATVLTDAEAEAAEVWLPAHPDPEASPASRAWEVDFIIPVPDCPLIADPRETMTWSKLKLNLLGEDRRSRASGKDVTSGSGPRRGHLLFLRRT